MKEIGKNNIAGQLNYRGAGNPPNSHPSTAVSNCFPGLEFDFRAIWRNVFVGITLHEASFFIADVEPGSVAANAGVSRGDVLINIDGQNVYTEVNGPTTVGGASVSLGFSNLEWTNSLGHLLPLEEREVPCVFQGGGGVTTVNLKIRPIADGAHLIERYDSGDLEGPVAEPGELTQGLCSPWQADYRECGCYYWAASRPDFVNVDPNGNDLAGDNWMQKVRSPAGQKRYQQDASSHEDPAAPSDQWTYEELYREWENNLRFIIKGNDE